MRFRLFVTIAAALLLLLAACGANDGAQQTPPADAPGEPGVPGVEPGVPMTGPAGTCPDGKTGEELFNQGEMVYATNCAQCHGQQGEGTANFSSLVESELNTGQDITALLRRYFEVDVHPPLEPEAAASVFTYTRNAWGQQADLVCPEQVIDAEREPQQ
jgi:mono/diheme cytochrome c family protein